MALSSSEARKGSLIVRCAGPLIGVLPQASGHERPKSVGESPALAPAHAAAVARATATAMAAACAGTTAVTVESRRRHTEGTSVAAAVAAAGTNAIGAAAGGEGGGRGGSGVGCAEVVIERGRLGLGNDEEHPHGVHLYGGSPWAISIAVMPRDLFRKGKEKD